jgi:hypothetical protein
MRNVIILGFVVLFFLHQDFWLWDDRTLLGGYLPSGLAYHMAFSIASSILWALAVRLAWPKDLEEAVLQDAQAASKDGPGA